VISLEDVSLDFGDVTVLSGIDLRVEPTEFVGLVGPNGAGKTSLLRLVNGVLDPDEGAVVVDGQRVSELSASELSRRLATVPQDTHVGFSFTAEQLVEMGRTPHQSRFSWRRDERPVEAAMDRTETTHLRERRVDELSGGERQRVLLARALAQEPSMLVLDEPTASLDINHQVGVLELVRALVDDGVGAIAAIHDLDLAARYCDRLVLLHDGEVHARGRPETVLERTRLATAFETETAVTKNPVTGTPTVAAIADRPDRDVRVHVVGGGEGAAAAVRALWREGFDVTVGLAPEGDVVAELANQLELEVVTAPAFERPAEPRRRAAAALAARADVLVLTEGPGDAGVADAVETPRIDATLASAGTGVARGDGGDADAVDDEQALLEAVLAAVGLL